MVPPAPQGLGAPRRGGCQGRRSPSGQSEDGWRLLVRIAQGRWVVLGLAVSFALVGSHPGVSRWWLLLLVVLAAAYNLAVTCHRRLPRLRPTAMALVTVGGDFAWVTAVTVLLASSPTGVTAAIGYVVVGSESGLLLGWSGALVALTAGVASLFAVGLAGYNGGVGASVRDVVYQASAVLASAMMAALGAAELHARNRELEVTSSALASHARTDHLTGLGNSVALDEALGSMDGRPHGLLLIDVDNMRWANTVYGHQAGDEMLMGVARVLATLREGEDLAIRISEDKFVLLLPSADQQRATAVAEAIRAAVHGVAVSGGRLRVSIGCAWSDGADDGQITMSRADDALYAAKARGGDMVALQGGPAGGGQWRLREAVESILQSDRGVYSVYQSVVRLDTRSVVGWEALSRPANWPADAGVEAMFLTAHRIGRGRDLDWRCRRNAIWEASRLTGSLFVNVNVAGLIDPVHDVDQMLLMCQWAGRAPQSVVLELSERDAIPDRRRLRGVLADYRAAGFRFALDDLGEGQTTLEVVLAARCEFLKLARPMLQAARVDAASRAAVRALARFAHEIEATVIAEGVEDQTDAELCLELGIDLGQGWLFGRPQPADRLPF